MTTRTKVEELRERLVNAELDSGSVGTEKEATEVVDSLISAVDANAFARGKAEGAAFGVSAVRRQLRAASASITKQEGTRSIGGIRHYLIPVRAFSVPIASVLAPTKESEK